MKKETLREKLLKKLCHKDFVNLDYWEEKVKNANYLNYEYNRIYINCYYKLIKKIPILKEKARLKGIRYHSDNPIYADVLKKVEGYNIYLELIKFLKKIGYTDEAIKVCKDAIKMGFKGEIEDILKRLTK